MTDTEGVQGEERRSDFVQSLARGLAVIRSFNAEHPEMSLSEVARATGLTRAAARRFLHTLVELGYVRTNGKLFALRPQILQLGYAYLSNLALPQVAQPHLEELREMVHESCSVSVLDGNDIVYVARASTQRILNVNISIGTRFPAYATSMGRALLAYLPEPQLEEFLTNVALEPRTARTVTDDQQLREILAQVRKDGYALVDQEFEQALRSIAVAIRNPTGEPVAAMNIATAATHPTADHLRTELFPPLREVASRIEAELHTLASSGAL